ncbi:MAG: histidine phosphatase family protein [Planctomycetes bacterium]|nr:histidine phosphatase family protein [Planctomycetota bacterium]
MSHVVLIHPGCTDFDEQNRVQGSLEIPMNARGETQVRSVVDRLRQMDLEVIYTSPGEPARSTAEILGAELDVKVKEVDELRNLDQGLWEGLCVDEIRHKFPRVYRQWRESPRTICPPQGETVDEALERIERALSKPLKRKDVFGVVASEPLATLVRFVLSGSPPEMPDPIASCKGGISLEEFDTSRNGHFGPHPAASAVLAGRSAGATTAQGGRTR